MPTFLLPSLAAPFSPRSAPNVVLNTNVEPLLTATLRRVNRVKRPLNNVMQHTRLLAEALSPPNAIWTLCLLSLPRTPVSALKNGGDTLIQPLINCEMVQIDAYVVYVDMVFQNEVAFKLTPEAIKSLVEFHNSIYCLDAAANSADWPGKESKLKKLQEDFV